MKEYKIFYDIGTYPTSFPTLCQADEQDQPKKSRVPNHIWKSTKQKCYQLVKPISALELLFSTQLPRCLRKSCQFKPI